MPVADIRISTVVTFRADSQAYGLPVERVREIQQIVAFADVPDEGDAIRGLIDIRGEIVPVVDARTLLGLPSAPYTLDTPMIVVLGPQGPVALVVDAVDAILDLDTDAAEPAPPMHSLASRILGVHHLQDGLVLVLDPDTLFTHVSQDVPEGELNDG